MDRLLADNGGSAADAAAIAAFSTEVRPAGSSAPGTPADAEAKPGFGGHRHRVRATGPHGRCRRRPPLTGPPPRHAVASPRAAIAISRWWGSVRGTSNEAEPEPASEANEKPPAAPPAAPRGLDDADANGEHRCRACGIGRRGRPGPRLAASDASRAGASQAGGDYRLQLTPTRSEDEARQLWQKVLGQNQQLASIEPLIEKTDMGNLGTFYRLQIGPFPDKAESLKLCNALKRSGVDCFLVNP